MSDPHVNPAIDLTGAAEDHYEDPTDADLATAVDAPASDLVDLEAELTADLTAVPIRLDVDGRPGYVAVYRRDFTGADVQKWRAASKRKGSDDVDATKFAGLAITRTLIRLERNGQTVMDPQAPAQPLTFSSPYLQDVYGVRSAIDAARRFFGGDGLLDGQFSSLSTLAGWGEGASEADDPS